LPPDSGDDDAAIFVQCAQKRFQRSIPSPKISEKRAVEYDTFFTEQGEKRKGNNRSWPI
jgi:hypothetical protein